MNVVCIFTCEIKYCIASRILENCFTLVSFSFNFRACYQEKNYVDALQLCLAALEIYSGDERAQQYCLKLEKKARAAAGK